MGLRDRLRGSARPGDRAPAAAAELLDTRLHMVAADSYEVVSQRKKLPGQARATLDGTEANVLDVLNSHLGAEHADEEVLAALDAAAAVQASTLAATRAEGGR